MNASRGVTVAAAAWLVRSYRTPLSIVSHDDAVHASSTKRGGFRRGGGHARVGRKGNRSAQRTVAAQQVDDAAGVAAVDRAAASAPANRDQLAVRGGPRVRRIHLRPQSAQVLTVEVTAARQVVSDVVCRAAIGRHRQTGAQGGCLNLQRGAGAERHVIGERGAPAALPQLRDGGRGSERSDVRPVGVLRVEGNRRDRVLPGRESARPSASTRAAR